MIEILTANPIGTAAIGAAIAVGICGIAAGLAEGGIGSTAIKNGCLEDNKFGKGLIMTTLGESQVIYGFTIAMIIVFIVMKGGMF